MITSDGASDENVVNLDEHREVASFVAAKLGANRIIFCAEMPDGTNLTYIPEEMTDMELVYAIQMLQDLRQARLNS